MSEHGLAGVVRRAMPSGHGLAALLAVAFGAAVLANLVNNLPATLVLLPAASAAGPGVLLAVLIGVNVGPNLTYVGSLATLLWRRVLATRGAEPELGDFLRLGVAVVPVAILAAVLALWGALSVIAT